MSWIKLHRRLLDSEVFKKPDHLKLWTYLLLKASHRGKTFRHGDQTIKIEPGSFVSGRQKIAEETGYSESKIRRFLAYKKATNKLTIKSTKQYSILTICKYSDYQLDEKETDQRIDHQTDHNQENSKSITTDVVIHKVGQTPKSKKKKTYKEHPQFQEWWSKYSKASSSPEGSREKAAEHYLICSQDFSPEQINLATRHYLIECRKAGYSTKHGYGFLDPGLIDQYQIEPSNLTDPPKQESFLDQQFKRIHGTEPEHAGSTTPRLESL